MKKLILFIAVCTLASCTSEKLDITAAIKTAESAIKLIGDKKYDELVKLYTSDFSSSETKEVREKKYNQIIDIVGPAVEYILTDSIRQNNTEEESRIVLKYNVKHERVNTTETYTIVKEEGKYLLADIFITNK